MFVVITLLLKQMMSFHREVCSKGADGMANSADPDKTAPRMTNSTDHYQIWVWTICPTSYLYKYLGSLWLYLQQLNLITRTPVFRVSDQVRHKPGCTAKEDS